MPSFGPTEDISKPLQARPWLLLLVRSIARPRLLVGGKPVVVVRCGGVCFSLETHAGTEQSTAMAGLEWGQSISNLALETLELSALNYHSRQAGVAFKYLRRCVSTLPRLVREELAIRGKKWLEDRNIKELQRATPCIRHATEPCIFAFLGTCFHRWSRSSHPHLEPWGTTDVDKVNIALAFFIT
jgi:hypothetical protein